jgi:hypothetical protein
MKPEEDETDLCADDNLIDAENHKYFDKDYLTKDICLIF